MQIAIIGGCWLVFTVAGFGIYKASSTDNNLRVMSCRSTLRKYQKLDESDRKSIF